MYDKDTLRYKQRSLNITILFPFLYVQTKSIDGSIILDIQYQTENKMNNMTFPYFPFLPNYSSFPKDKGS